MQQRYREFAEMTSTIKIADALPRTGMETYLSKYYGNLQWLFGIEHQIKEHKDYLDRNGHNPHEVYLNEKHAAGNKSKNTHHGSLRM